MWRDALGEVAAGATVKAPAEARPGRLDLRSGVRVQPRDEVRCLAPRTLDLTVPLTGAPAS